MVTISNTANYMKLSIVNVAMTAMTVGMLAVEVIDESRRVCG